eukprot:7300887-Alexandrium_andersonii.AAC.1
MSACFTPSAPRGRFVCRSSSCRVVIFNSPGRPQRHPRTPPGAIQEPPRSSRELPGAHRNTPGSPLNPPEPPKTAIRNQRGQCRVSAGAR